MKLSRWFQKFKFPIFIIFILCIGSLHLQADEKKIKDNETILISTEAIEEKLNDLDSKIVNLIKTESDQLANELGATKKQIQQKILTLTKLKSAYQKLKNTITGLDKAKQEKRTTEHIYDDFRTKGMTKKPPYSLAFYDSIKVEIKTVDRHRQNIESSINILNRDIEGYKNKLSEDEPELRQRKEKMLNEADGHSENSNTIDLEILETIVQSQKIFLQALKLEKDRFEIDVTNLDIKENLLKDQEKFIKANIHYDQVDLNHQLEIIEKKKTETANELQKLRKDQKLVELEWGKAQEKLTLAENETERITAQAYLKAREEWRQTYNIVLEMKQTSLALLERQQIVWKDRYTVVKGDIAYQQEKEIKDEAEKRIDTLNHALQIQQNYLNNLQNQIYSIDSLIQVEGVSDSAKKYLTVEKDALARRFERRLEYQSLIIASDQLEQNLLTQIKVELNEISAKEQAIRFSQIIKKLWNFEIWSIDQNSVYFGKILIAIIILIIGIILTRYIMRRIHVRLLNSSQLKETAASALYKGLSYFSYLMVFLFALRMVNIPLTAFAFLGGAFAIGIGFGAQNLINNFISGFIILGERPIHIGDLIEVDGLLGKVEEIGARCTRVRTGENVHKLIPNSSFLEKNITNWTLSDRKIRTKVVVGVAYGSPVDKVEECLLDSTASNRRILKSPEPFVLFSDFGDNALIFEIYFWLTVRMVLEKKKQIESQVRFEIDSAFKKNNIVIAFPQMDLHFDTNRPLNIQMIGQSENKQ